MSDNAPISGGGIDLPDTGDIYTPEQAEEAINKFNASTLADPNHPYWDNNHPQHKDVQARLRELYKLRYPEGEDEPDRPKDIGTLTHEAMADQECAQYDRVAKGRELMDELGAEGIETCDIPPDLTEAEAVGLETQLMAARNQWPEVEGRIQWALERVNVPHHVWELFLDFRQATKNESKYAYAVGVLRALVAAWHDKTGFKRTPSQEKEDAE